LTDTSNAGYSKTQTGDLLYVYGPGLGDVITGHGAFWDKTKQSFFTADIPEGGTVFDAKTTYFSAKHQIDDKTSDTAMKLLHVNSSKTESERQQAVQASYNAYNGRNYWIPLLKSNDSGGLYCSQDAWLTWKRMGVNIDGAWWCTSFFAQNLVKKVIPVTITVGWWKVTIYITVFLLVVTLLTLDLIYPWDMVIDDDTAEYARFGKAYPGQ
jgi:hypothetical protein